MSYTNDRVINELIERHIGRYKKGVETYGASIEHSTRKLSKEQWVDEALDEALDLCVYLMKLKDIIRNESV